MQKHNSIDCDTEYSLPSEYYESDDYFKQMSVLSKHFSGDKIPQKDDLFFFNHQVMIFLYNNNPVSVVETKTGERKQVNGYDYIKSYRKGFIEGKVYFKDNYSTYSRDFYNANKDLCLKNLKALFFPSDYNTWRYLGSCWRSAIDFDLHKISITEFEKIGYLSGILYEFCEMIKAHPAVFKEFFSYKDYLINENDFKHVFLEIAYTISEKLERDEEDEIVMDNVDFEIHKEYMLMEIKKANIPLEYGILKIEHYVKELEKFCNNIDSEFEIRRTMDTIIFMPYASFGLETRGLHSVLIKIVNLIKFGEVGNNCTTNGLDKNFKELKDLFSDTENWKKYFDCFIGGEVKLLKKENNKYVFCGNEKIDRGLISTYMKKLKDRGIVDKSASSSIIARVLSENIENYHIGKSTFYNEPRRYKEFEKHLP